MLVPLYLFSLAVAGVLSKYHAHAFAGAAITFIVAVVYIAINFVVDMSYAFLDPRAVKR